MASYLVTYDLHKADSERYKKLDEKLASMSGVRFLESAWLVPYDDGAKNLYEKVVYPFSKPDEVIITKTSRDADYALEGDHLGNAKSFFNLK